MFKLLVLLLLFLLSVLYFPSHMKLLFVYILFCYLLTKFFNGEYISIEVTLEYLIKVQGTFIDLEIFFYSGYFENKK